MTDAEKKASAWGRDQNRGEYKPTGHVVLTTHPRRGSPITVNWGAGELPKAPCLLQCLLQQIMAPQIATSWV